MFRLIALLVALTSATAAAAQTPSNAGCSTRDDLLNRLSEGFSEDPIALGVATSGGVLEVLSSASGATWTIIITTPDGQSCLFASGESWQDLPLTGGGQPPSKIQPSGMPPA